MDNYETFKKECLQKWKTQLPELTIAQFDEILHNLDITAQKYDIDKKEMELISIDDEGFPQIVKFFLTAKAVEEKSPGTLTLYKLILLNFFQTLKIPFNQVTTNDIRVYLYNYKQQHNIKNITLDTMRRILNSF